MCAEIITGKTTTPAQIELAKAYANAVKLSEQSGYTDDSYTELSAALDETKAVFAKLDDMTDEQISEKADKMNEAAGGLVKTSSKRITRGAAQNGIACAYGTAFENLSLPETVSVTLADGTVTECAVEWNGSGYSPNLSGVYMITGTLITVSPANAADRTVKWSSSNPKTATVNANGRMTAKSAGKAVITAAAADGSDVKASVKVVKGGRVEYDGITFYKVKLNGCCYWVNKNYLTK